MKAHRCSVDIGNEVLVVNGREKRLSTEGFLGCYRMRASKTVSIPPRSEMIVPGKVCVPEGFTLPVGESIIEPLYNKCRNECALTARTIVSPNKNVPVRLMNTEEDAKVVHSGTVIGQLSEVAQVVVSLPQEKPSCADLSELLQKIEENLSSLQREKAGDLLMKYASLFAEHNLDLGRTDVVKHQINTGDSRPIKQQPRRIQAPYNRRDEQNRR